MSKLSVQSSINAPSICLWKIISDFDKVHRYHPYVTRPTLLSDKKRGIGAIWRCDMNNDTYFIEEVIQWVEGERITVKETHFHASNFKFG